MKEFDRDRLDSAYRRMMVGKEELFGYIRGRLDEICHAALSAQKSEREVRLFGHHSDMTVYEDDTLPFMLNAEVFAEFYNPSDCTSIELKVGEIHIYLNTNSERLKGALETLEANVLRKVSEGWVTDRISEILNL